MPPRRAIVVAFVVLLGLALGAPDAQADIIFLEGNVPQTDENVLFNQPGLISGPALLVTGATNNTGFIVNFLGNENLVTPSAGQARIEGADGDFTSVVVSLTSGVFTSYIVNVNLEPGPDATVQFSVDEFGAGVTVSPVFDLGNGNNFFTIVAVNGQLIESVLIAASGDVIEDIRQNRIGGAQSPQSPPAVPEPATLLLVGAGLVGLAASVRRRRLKR